MGDAPGVPSRWFGGILWREFGIGLCMSYIRLLLFAKMRSDQGPNRREGRESDMRRWALGEGAGVHGRLDALRVKVLINTR